MGSGALTHIPSFIKTGPAIQKLIGRDTHRDTQTQTAMWSHKPTFFLIRRLKMVYRKEIDKWHKVQISQKSTDFMWIILNVTNV
jgi:uncharacterized pyridoxamine 5'-phosphate oxidase family protein